MIEGEKMGSHRKEFLKLKCLSPVKMLTSPLFEEIFGAFLFLSLSLSLLLHLLRTWGGLMIFEEKITSSKTCFQMVYILTVDAYSGMEFCMPTWLNHDYGDGGVVDILAVDAYSGVFVCTPIFMGEASN
jgi:hypothetical protein